jgi:hypothetical protein
LVFIGFYWFLLVFGFTEDEHGVVPSSLIGDLGAGNHPCYLLLYDFMIGALRPPGDTGPNSRATNLISFLAPGTESSRQCAAPIDEGPPELFTATLLLFRWSMVAAGDGSQHATSE